MKGGRRNGSGKVIPAVKAAGSGGARIFFFDDNLNLILGGCGKEDSGICNLRDIETAAFVEFAPGVNGFVHETAFKHTLVSRSEAYTNVLVQANILDALSVGTYFSDIVSGYSEQSDTVIIHLDINSTILVEDSAAEKGKEGVLLSTMFSLTELVPKEPFTFAWEDRVPIEVSKRMTLQKLAVDLFKHDNERYNRFWGRGNCADFLNASAFKC